MSKTRPVKNQMAYHEKINNLGNVQNQAFIDIPTSTVHKMTLIGDTTCFINAIPAADNVPAGCWITFTLIVLQDAVGGRNFQINNIKYPYGSVPSVDKTANAKSVISYFSDDSGLTWNGIMAGNNFS